MSSQPLDKIEGISNVLALEIENLDTIELTFAATLVRIALVDLQMRLHGITEKEIDVLSFAYQAIEQEKSRRADTSSERPECHET